MILEILANKTHKWLNLMNDFAQNFTLNKTKVDISVRISYFLKINIDSGI
jgi:hypothetical protein